MQTAHKPSHHHSLREAARIIIESGLVNKNPTIRSAISSYLSADNPERLTHLLKRHPRILEAAKNLIDKDSYRKSALPFEQPTAKEAQEQLSGELFIGIANNQKSKFCINPNDLLKKMLILGQPGTGKTYIQLLLLFQILESRQRDFNIIIFDKKDDYSSLVRYFPHLFYLTGEDIRYNPFETYDWESPYKHLTAMVADICAINYFKAASLPIITHATLNTYRSRGYVRLSDMLFEVKRIAKSTYLKGARSNDVFFSILTRLESFRNITFDIKSGYPLDFWESQDIIINTDDMDKYVASTFATTLMNKLFRCYKARSQRGRLRTLFVFDEAYWMFETDQVYEVSSMETVANTFRQSREFGIGHILAAQEFKSLSSFIQRNCQVILCLKTLGDGVKDAAHLLNLTAEQQDYFMSMPPERFGIARVPNFTRPFIFKTPKSLRSEKSITAEELHSLTADKRNALLTAWISSHPQGQSESEGGSKGSKQTTKKEEGFSYDSSLTSIQHRILASLEAKPFLIQKELQKELNNMNLNSLKRELSDLIEAEYIKEIDCIHLKNNRRSHYFALTQKAYDCLNTSSAKRISPGQFKHTLYQERVAQFTSGKKEYCPKGHENRSERIDVATTSEGMLKAYEIIISDKTLTLCIEKCQRMKADKIIIVAETKHELDTLKDKLRAKIAEKQLPDNILDSVEFASISEFIDNATFKPRRT